MTFALATVGLGLPQVAGAVLGIVLSVRWRRRARRAARWALAASLTELVLVVGDLALLGSVDLVRAVTFGTEQTLDAISDVLVLLSILALVPLLYAVQLDRNLQVPTFGRRTGPPAAGIPPGTRSRWEEVLPPSGDTDRP